MENKNNFNWKEHPQAWEWFVHQVKGFITANDRVSLLASELLENTGTRIIDFADHLVVTEEPGTISSLEAWGFLREKSVFTHPSARLPRVLFKSDGSAPAGLAVAVDDITQFLMVRGLDLPIEGSAYSAFRRCRVAVENDTALWVVERRDARVMEPVEKEGYYLDTYFKTLGRWMTRPRVVEDDAAAMEGLIRLAREQVNLAGVDLAAYLFFEAERRYWQSRNRAAGIQKFLQDSVGMGWANHDHHTFRSSRAAFSQLIKFFQVLGFHCREKFFAGEEAGWGAQVVENPVIGISLFLDVDLSAGELDIDFTTRGLEPGGELGTVGLWCALHGGSIFRAGLHHLAVLSDFDRLTGRLKTEKVKMMKPFSTLPHLRQAFTRGERWAVETARVERLLRDRLITEEAAEVFLKEGVVGSHLENIQRENGFKGFSQKEVSSIIEETDPQTYRFES